MNRGYLYSFLYFSFSSSEVNLNCLGGPYSFYSSLSFYLLLVEQMMVKQQAVILKVVMDVTHGFLESQTNLYPLRNSEISFLPRAKE